MTLNFKKHDFFTKFIDYLRHVICPGHLKMTTQMIGEIGRLEFTTSLTELRSILGSGTLILPKSIRLRLYSRPVNEKAPNRGASEPRRTIQRRYYLLRDDMKETHAALSTGAVMIAKLLYCRHRYMPQVDWHCSDTNETGRN